MLVHSLIAARSGNAKIVLEDGIVITHQTGL